jgi:serine protease Do
MEFGNPSSSIGSALATAGGAFHRAPGWRSKLVNSRAKLYDPRMPHRITWFLVLSVCATVSAGDVVQLKNNALVAGRILAEKPDQIVVDIGYTVLIVPRAEILKVNSGGSVPSAELEAGAATTVSVTRPESAPGALLEQAVPSTQMRMFKSGSNGRPDRTVRELVSHLGEAVVQVRTPSGLGSGFIINDEGYLITNFHVIESETQISVEVYHQRNGQLERRSYRQVRIVAMNKYADLALLKIEDKEAPTFVTVDLGDSDSVGVGERVFAIGSPLGLERTVTEGIVSTTTRPMQGELYLQTTTPINPGSNCDFFDSIGYGAAGKFVASLQKRFNMRVEGL